MKRSEKQQLKNAAALFGLRIILTPVRAIVLAGTCATLWRWFAAESLGAGPSNAAWYGISLIAGILVGASTINLPKIKDDEQPVIGPLARDLGLLVACGIVLGVSWLTGQIVGWL